MGTRSLGLAVLVLALLIGAGFGFARLDLEGLLRFIDGEPQLGEESSERGERSNMKSANAAATKKETDRLTELASQLGAAPSEQPDGPSFDIARISPDGVSVFAGRSKPHERVNVLVGDLIVGTASADGEGNWTLVTEKKIPDISAELKLKTGMAAPPESDRRAAPPADANNNGAAKGPPESATEVNKRLFASLQGMVDEARAKNASESKEPAELISGTVSTPATPELQQFAAAEALPSGTLTSGVQVQSRSIPIPVQFVYREAEFTDQGREAVGLLLEYLKASRLERVTLSGHADERGSSELNMQLSRDRLNAVRDRLQAGGYTGDLVLVPKGETEPFAGVDRSSLPPEDLFQLDRRVELRLEN